MATAQFDMDFPLRVTLESGGEFHAADVPIRVHLRSDLDADDWCIDRVEMEQWEVAGSSSYHTLSRKDYLHACIECSAEVEARAKEAWRHRERPVREYEAAA